jgi:predicted membrane-bound dolichyl-phosphate-mannose-protein mannosyltransferase
VYLLKKIAQIKYPKHVLPIMVFFALNPLVVIESVVSAHLDIGMVAFSYLFLLLLLKKQKVYSLSALSLSVGIKYVTLVLIPLLLTGFNRNFIVFLMIFGTLGVLAQIEIQPWYLLWTLPFLAFYPDKKWVWPMGIAFSFGLLLRYAPYFYFGHWNDPVPYVKFLVTYGSIVVGLVYLAGLFLIRKTSQR